MFWIRKNKPTHHPQTKKTNHKITSYLSRLPSSSATFGDSEKRQTIANSQHSFMSLHTSSLELQWKSLLHMVLWPPALAIYAASCPLNTINEVLI